MLLSNSEGQTEPIQPANPSEFSSDTLKRSTEPEFNNDRASARF